MSDEKPTPLTAADAVPLETLKRFDELDTARYEVAGQLLNVEQERVRLLAAAHQVDTQRQRMFEKILVERGLEPSTQIQIDSKTGAIRVMTSSAPPPESSAA